MKINELKENEMEQVCGGNFFADLEEVLFSSIIHSAEKQNELRMQGFKFNTKGVYLE